MWDLWEGKTMVFDCEPSWDMLTASIPRPRMHSVLNASLRCSGSVRHNLNIQ